MRTIAIEEHFLATGFAEARQRSGQSVRGGRNDAVMVERQAKLLDLGATRLREMDAAGIDLQVISHSAAMMALPADEGVRLSRQANDQLAAAVAAHPTRFAGLATLPMRTPGAATNELERAVRELGFEGAMIDGTTDGRFLDDPVFLPVLERAVALDVPLYVHPGVPPDPVREAYYSGFDPVVSFALGTSGWGWHAEAGLHALRLILAGVFDRLPTLQIILGHMGEMLPFMLARIQNSLTPVARHLQRPIPAYFRSNFHFTTSGFFTEPPLALAIEGLGVERILFAVDYPYSSNEQGRAFLESISLSPEAREMLTHRNAERLLKLPAA